MSNFTILLFDLISLLVYCVVCYEFIDKLLLLCFQLRKKNKILLQRNSNMDLKTNCIKYCLGLAFFLILEKPDLSIQLSLMFLNVIFYFISSPDKNDVLESFNLNIGYGAALWYFKNYLTTILPDQFRERVRTFESINKVEVDEKLYILVPKSCIVPKYLDDEKDCIERCQELPKCEVTNSGIKKRVYNITVYLLKNNYVKKRMAIEYASPLKGLYSFKEKKFLTEEEMLHERQLFVKSLHRFLKDDGKGLFKFCEIVEFNDKESKVSDVLLLHNNFGNSVYDIV